jgi:peptide/nickel transport system substrate-binding protein
MAVGSVGTWIYVSDYLPTGEWLFSSGAAQNNGFYDDPIANRLISKTLTSSGLRYMFAYENYLAQQLPDIWQPNVNDVTPFEVSKNLGGVSPINTLGTLTPEY